MWPTGSQSRRILIPGVMGLTWGYLSLALWCVTRIWRIPSWLTLQWLKRVRMSLSFRRNCIYYFSQNNKSFAAIAAFCPTMELQTELRASETSDDRWKRGGLKKTDLSRVCKGHSFFFSKPSLEKVMSYYRFIVHCTISPLKKLISLPPLNSRSSVGIGNINRWH